MVFFLVFDVFFVAVLFFASFHLRKMGRPQAFRASAVSSGSSLSRQSFVRGLPGLFGVAVWSFFGFVCDVLGFFLDVFVIFSN